MILKGCSSEKAPGLLDLLRVGGKEIVEIATPEVFIVVVAAVTKLWPRLANRNNNQKILATSKALSLFFLLCFVLVSSVNTYKHTIKLFIYTTHAYPTTVIQQLEENTLGNRDE